MVVVVLGGGCVCWSVVEDIWVVTHLPLLQICVRPLFVLDRLAFADWNRKAAVSSTVV